jgi:hypothetical protein
MNDSNRDSAVTRIINRLLQGETRAVFINSTGGVSSVPARDLDELLRTGKLPLHRVVGVYNANADHEQICIDIDATIRPERRAGLAQAS